MLFARIAFVLLVITLQIVSCAQTQTSDSSSTSSGLTLVSSSPSEYSIGIEVSNALTLTFDQAISQEGITINNFFTEITSYAAHHEAGVPDLTGASLTFSADAKTITIANLSGWSSLTPFYGARTVHITPKEDKITDLSGNGLSTDTLLWYFSLASIETTSRPIDLGIFTSFVTDEVNDPFNTSGHPPLGPQYLATIDYTRIAASVVGDLFYVYIGIAGTFEGGASTANTNYPDEEIGLCSFDFRFNLDNSFVTGMDQGYELITVCYLGERNDMTATGWISDSSEMPGGPTHAGWVNNGGIGSNYVVFSVPISDLSSSPSPGDQITARVWCEAESTNYHHFAFDAYNDDNDITMILGGE